MIKSPFGSQSEYVTRKDLNEFKDQVQEKLIDMKNELVEVINDSSGETFQRVRTYIAQEVVPDIKEHTRMEVSNLRSQMAVIRDEILEAIKK